LENKDEFAKQNFDKYYEIWKQLLPEKLDDKVWQDSVMSHMLEGGVATLPYVIDKIEKGDESLIPTFIELTKINIKLPRNIKERQKLRVVYSLPVDATKIDCLNWWAKNKQKWLIFDPNE
jgi:hypothetical protein